MSQIISSDSDDCIILPTAEECNKLCEKFVKATNGDSALAMYYLQDRDWDIERSLNDYFSDNPTKQRVVEKDRDSLKWVSWNIDGIDSSQLGQRMNSVCSTIQSIMPDIVFLQEVVPHAETIIQDRLGAEYWFTSGHQYSGQRGEYYVAILVNRSILTQNDRHSVKVTRFPGSVMGRYILSVRIHLYHELPITLMTTHLESTADFSNERKRQLQQCFEVINEAPSGDHVLFGGDLNLRDNEIENIPDKTFDLWEMTGARPEARYTWDTTRNNNINVVYKARCRFDRQYMRKSKLSREHKAEMIPVYFELIGLEKVVRSQKFASDHWGILSHFKINIV